MVVGNLIHNLGENVTSKAADLQVLEGSATYNCTRISFILKVPRCRLMCMRRQQNSGKPSVGDRKRIIGSSQACARLCE